MGLVEKEEKMTKIEFYIGTEYETDKKRLDEDISSAAMRATDTLLVAEYEGYTIQEALGKYRDFPIEDVIVLTCCYATSAPLEEAEQGARKVAVTLAELWRQESVLFTVQEVGGGLAFAHKV